MNVMWDPFNMEMQCALRSEVWPCTSDADESRHEARCYEARGCYNPAFCASVTLTSLSFCP